MIWADRALVISPYYYGLCTSKKEFKKELKRLRIPKSEWPDFLLPNANATVHFFTNVKDKQECAIVCIHKDEGHSIAQIAALIAHESVHIWQAIEDYIGERNASKEFEAYSVQSITQELLAAYFGERK